MISSQFPSQEAKSHKNVDTFFFFEREKFIATKQYREILQEQILLNKTEW